MDSARAALSTTLAAARNITAGMAERIKPGRLPQVPLTVDGAAAALMETVAALKNVKFDGFPQAAMNYTVATLGTVKVDGLRQAAKDSILAHPRLTAVQLAAVVVTFFPMLASSPIFVALGFRVLGPLGGTTAAVYQSANGATTIFRYLQSAGMGGYGVLAVNRAMQGGAVAAAALAEWFKKNETMT